MQYLRVFVVKTSLGALGDGDARFGDGKNHCTRVTVTVPDTSVCDGKKPLNWKIFDPIWHLCLSLCHSYLHNILITFINHLYDFLTAVN